MFKYLLPAAAALFLISSPSFAGHCPKDVKHIDAVLAKSTVPADVKATAKAKALRDQGKALHKAKKHGESLQALHEALHLLGEKHK
ncbi:MAG: hypothetical protein VW268_10880 [Rhodospirillaceae bacterium]